MNRTAYISHPSYLQHDTGTGHPESPQRLIAIENKLKESRIYDQLTHFEAPLVTGDQLERVHDINYLSEIEQKAPTVDGDTVYLDPDTSMSAHSLEAAKSAAGAVVLATDLVLNGEVDNAFCAVRPPGHHAKQNQSMGFCIYNNIMVGVYHALASGMKRVALLDFDVHHGNGSENIIADDKRILFCSTFQHPYYPGERFKNNDHIICCPLDAGSGSKEFRDTVNSNWIPSLDNFKPEIIFISAGFDAHIDDQLAGLNFTTDDYKWVTKEIMDISTKYASGRVVSVLEGGYNTIALADSVDTHIKTLLGQR